MKMSLVIPCYNEAQSLPILIVKLNAVISDPNVEVIIVDNGSTDNTSEILRGLILDSNSTWRSIRVEENKGYGFGIMEGLRAARGDVLAWTHADLQTDPSDALRGFELFSNSSNPEKLFVKGLRYGRPTLDALFTFGMSVFETLLMRKPMRDINAQPTMFHRSLFIKLQNPPDDFALDLYVYWKAVRLNFVIRRFPVLFGPRKFGSSHWNSGMKARLRFIKRTVSFSLKLRKNLEKD